MIHHHQEEGVSVNWYDIMKGTCIEIWLVKIMSKKVWYTVYNERGYLEYCCVAVYLIYTPYFFKYIEDRVNLSKVFSISIV